MFSAALWSALSLCPHVGQSNLAWSRFPESACPQWLHCWLVYAGLAVTVLTLFCAALYAVNSCDCENGHWLSVLRRVLLVLVPLLLPGGGLCVKSSNAMTLMFGVFANCFDAQWLVSRMSRFPVAPSPVGGGGRYGRLFPATFSCCARSGVLPPFACESRRCRLLSNQWRERAAPGPRPARRPVRRAWTVEAGR